MPSRAPPASCLSLGDSRTVMGCRHAGGGRSRSASTDAAEQTTPAGCHAPAGAPEAASAGEAGRLYAVRLSSDHKPEAAAERARIEAAGGRVCPFLLSGKPVGPPRVWAADEWAPGLAVARSFGDSAAAAFGVSAVPEVRSYELHSRCELVVLGSDGVWDLIDDEQAVAIVADSVRAGSPQQASAELCRRALAALQSARRKDNVTALVLTFAQAQAGAASRRGSDLGPELPAPQTL